jgi:hypothetical protein
MAAAIVLNRSVFNSLPMPQSHGHRVEDVHFPEETQSGQMPLLRHRRKRFYSSHSSSLRVGPTGTREAPSSECMTRLGRSIEGVALHCPR